MWRVRCEEESKGRPVRLLRREVAVSNVDIVWVGVSLSVARVKLIEGRFTTTDALVIGLLIFFAWPRGG